MNDPLIQAVLLTHVAATVAMYGLIWFVQLVHYPLLAMVGRDTFRAYHEAYVRRVVWIVGPLMLIELASAVALLPMLGTPFFAYTLTGLLLLLLIWCSTILVQVPLHRCLSEGFDTRAHARLVGTNWWRTALWSVRAPLACVLIALT